MPKKYYKKNPTSKWCNPNTILTESELDQLNDRIISHILLKQAYKGDGCWDLNKILMAYAATLDETKRLGKFPNLNTNLIKKLIILEDFVMKEYVEFEYNKTSKYIDEQHFYFLRKKYVKKI